jgi:enamidase
MERRFVRKGGLLMSGTDPTGFGGVIPGFSARRQIELMVQGGFTFPQAVQISTLNGARFALHPHPRALRVEQRSAED